MVLPADSEVVEVEQVLRGILTEAGLSWVIAQVDEGYREGITEVTSTQSLGGSSSGQSGFPIEGIVFEEVASPPVYHEGNKRKALTSRPPEPRERVEALISAIERVAIELPKVKSEALRALVDNPQEMPSADSVTFIADDHSNTADGWSLQTAGNMEMHESIGTALTRLREEIAIEQR